MESSNSWPLRGARKRLDCPISGIANKRKRDESGFNGTQREFKPFKLAHDIEGDLIPIGDVNPYFWPNVKIDRCGPDPTLGANAVTVLRREPILPRR